MRSIRKLEEGGRVIPKEPVRVEVLRITNRIFDRAVRFELKGKDAVDNKLTSMIEKVIFTASVYETIACLIEKRDLINISGF